MKRALISIAGFVSLSIATIAAQPEFVINRSDITAVEVTGEAVTLSIAKAADREFVEGRHFDVRITFPTAGLKDMYIGGAAFAPSSTTITFKFPDAASAAKFAVSITKRG